MERDLIDPEIGSLEARLEDFSSEIRSKALADLRALARRGRVRLEPASDVANMHCHTFYSYNASGYSPTSLAWLAKRRGFGAMGIVDFDVLEGVDEFLTACDLLGVRGSAGMETRVFIPEFADREINSPGEPGVLYHMGIGFTSSQASMAVAGTLSELRWRATSRNQDLIRRINAHLAPLEIDYDRDVLPLTPRGNATERHIVVAYVRKAQASVSNPATFWANRLGVPVEQIDKVVQDAPGFQSLVRAKLMKRGGVGYVQPGSRTFPSVEEVNKLIMGCGALPCAAGGVPGSGWSAGRNRGFRGGAPEFLEAPAGGHG